MKSVWRHLPLLLSTLMLSIPLARAQSAIDFGIGGGTAFNSPSGFGIDNLDSPNNAFGPCVPGSRDPYCEATPGLHGFFLGFGGDIMFTQRFGAGAEVNFQPVHQGYGPLESRQTFFDFNGIYQPLVRKRAIVQLQGGIGSSTTSFIFQQNSCVGAAVVCNNYSSSLGSTTHFQFHVGAGLQIPITEHFFVRPQFDFHFVPNFTEQFGRSTVPAFTVWVGYHFGER